MFEWKIKIFINKLKNVNNRKQVITICQHLLENIFVSTSSENNQYLPVRKVPITSMTI